MSGISRRRGGVCELGALLVPTLNRCFINLDSGHQQSIRTYEDMSIDKINVRPNEKTDRYIHSTEFIGDESGYAEGREDKVRSWRHLKIKGKE